MNNGSDPRLNLWSIILMSGCGAMFLAFFMPWWGITVTLPAPPSKPKEQEAYQEYNEDLKDWKETMDDIQKHLDKHERKHKKILGEEYWEEKSEDLEKQGKDEAKEALKGESASSVSVTAWVWGCNYVGVALTAFIFSILLLPVAIVPMFVKFLRNWIWIGYFVAAVSGLVLFILALVWYFSSPGDNLPKYVEQGVGWYPGPYLEILGSLATLAAGVLGGVFGLLTFLNNLKAKQQGGGRARTAPAHAEDDDMDFVEDDEL